MDEHDRLAERFQAHRSQLRAIAYRMLGSLSEADDAVQEAWVRLSRSDPNEIENLAAWLTTVTGRVCLDMLRSRTSRREEPLESQLPGTVVGGDGSGGGNGDTSPEEEALLADSVGLALLVVLDTLGPAERLAFVLHDMFAVPFDQIGPIVGRSPVAAKKLASRARHRAQGRATVPDADLRRQRQVVDAFLVASRQGDFEALVELLDPDVVRRADLAAAAGGRPVELRGARAVATETLTSAQRARLARPVLVDGALGIVAAPRGRLQVALRLTIEGDKIAEIDVIADPTRLRLLDLAVLAA